MTDAWYAPAAAYWVLEADAPSYPLRYGDVVATPDLPACQNSKGKGWAHVLVLHPRCELGAKASADTEVLDAWVMGGPPSPGDDGGISAAARCGDLRAIVALP